MSRETVIAKVAAVKPRKVNGTAGPDAPRFRLLTVPELLAAPPPAWTVQDIIPERGVGVIWGASGSGKTFAALDLACAVVRGVPWHGHAVDRGPVLYVATEGRLALRLGAYMDHQGITDDDLADLRVLESRVNLLNGDAHALIESITAAGITGTRLVIVDTLNRAMPGGNENASEDMGRMVDAASAIATATESVAIYVHHSGKDQAQGSRGHSSLKAAADFELSVRRDGDVRSIEIEKVRDAEDGYTLTGFTLIPVGESVVLSPTDAPAEKVKPIRLTPAERIALDALHELLKDRERRRDASVTLIDAGAKHGQFVVLIEDWRAAVYARFGSDITQATKRQNFNRARERLTANRRVQIHEDHAWLHQA